MARRSRGWFGLVWTGVVLVVVGLGVFLALLGLERANQTAGVLSLFVSLVGVVVAAAAYRADRRDERGSAPRADRPDADRPGSVHNQISGGHFHGTVIQAGRISGSAHQPRPHRDDDPERDR
ncbi:hypothetical protein AB0I53_12440 [Saccharopolyspora sp. NPDC050389]|uniref:hypothetical protein n=1 Tax=Saccharopolyspora sp. NPDC050389 TaxID=3155516 RepID=UPI0033CBF583